MGQRDRIRRLVYDAIDELNQDLLEVQRLEKDEGVILLGTSGKLDSLQILNLVLIIEKNLEKEFNRQLSLMDESTLTQADDPFMSVGSLVKYVAEIVEALGA
jgi:acyl carrier protein